MSAGSGPLTPEPPPVDRPFLQLVHSLWQQQGQWPLVAKVAKDASRNLPGDYSSSKLRAEPPTGSRVAFSSTPGEERLVLTATGLAALDGPVPLASSFLWVVQLLAAAEDAHDPQEGQLHAVVSRDQIARHLADGVRGRTLEQGYAFADRVWPLLWGEGVLWHQVSDPGGDWQIEVSENAPRFAGAKSLDDYVERARRLTQVPPPMQPPEEQVPMSSPDAVTPDPRNVFLVHGRDERARRELVTFLEALDLRIVTWHQASEATGDASPYTLEIVTAGMALARAVVVLFTPDDLGQCKPEFLQPRDESGERNATGQARLNVILEAGMALALDRSRTLLVEVGSVRQMSDLSGVNTLRMDGSVHERRGLISRLKTAGLAVDEGKSEWWTAGNFAPWAAPGPAAPPLRPGLEETAVDPLEETVPTRVLRCLVERKLSMQTSELVEALSLDESVVNDAIQELHDDYLVEGNRVFDGGDAGGIWIVSAAADGRRWVRQHPTTAKDGAASG